jgi:hypothetical protein
MSYSQIIDKLNISPLISGKTLRKKGSSLSGIINKKYPEYKSKIKTGFISDIFKIIDTEFKAYWIGFFMADGSIVKNEILLELSIKDVSHLNKFKEFIGVDTEIKFRKRLRKGKYNKTCLLRFSSKSIKEQLNELNIISNKTYCGQFADLSKIPYDLHKDFWRGYIDGDGHINTSNLIMCFNYNTYNEFLKYLDYLLIPQYYEIRNNDDSVNNAIRFPQQISKLILDIIYQNSNVYLERKYNEYQKIKIKIQNYYIENNIICKYNEGDKRNKLTLNYENYENFKSNRTSG